MAKKKTTKKARPVPLTSATHAELTAHLQAAFIALSWATITAGEMNGLRLDKARNAARRFHRDTVPASTPRKGR